MSDAILRHPTPLSIQESWAREFSQAIEIPAGAKTITLSGVGALPCNREAGPRTVAYFGDMQTQTRSVLDQIRQILESRGYALGDVVAVQALFVADPANDGMPDFDAFSTVYRDYFGSPAQPALPTRTRAQVVRLVEPGWLVEVTVTAARVVNA
ncbi:MULTISPECIES: RidA family protein [Burkholderia]|uniref:2-aminomuconate deaminase n=1 Tax=Burkholderia paludis TaxID=1506587 RepID=A0A6J5D0A2_9BURK|nr:MULTISPECIES: RidA family protein [Burkholderia]CAB3746096.1 Putative aminoacrylate peracid reductase RutC [Burkholderia paludis]VWB23185.1 2-aminomuconate deaminase [Burkholderia paludis]